LPDSLAAPLGQHVRLDSVVVVVVEVLVASMDKKDYMYDMHNE
jgi:hypothetical protein